MTEMTTPQFVGVVSSEYDASFKEIISAGWAETSTGAVDEMGHWALIPIPENERGELVDAVFSDGELPRPDPGWYVAVENSDGIIVVYSYPDEETMRASWRDVENAVSAFDDEKCEGE